MTGPTDKPGMTADQTWVAIEDVGAILRALGLGDHARPHSAHAVVHEEIIPEIDRLRAELAEIGEKNHKLATALFHALYRQHDVSGGCSPCQRAVALIQPGTKGQTSET